MCRDYNSSGGESDNISLARVGVKVMERGMKGGKKQRAHWNSDAERKLIELWAETMKQTDSKMMTRKKEVLVTKQLNEYVKNNLRKHTLYSEKDVHNKIDSILRKGKLFYTTYKVTGKELDDSDVQLDLEAAWPNFKVFHLNFKDYPSLGPGAVEDIAELVVPATSIKVEHASSDESSCSRSDETRSRSDETRSRSDETHSRSDESSRSTPRPECDSEEDDDEVEIVSPPAEKKKLDARTNGKSV